MSRPLNHKWGHRLDKDGGSVHFCQHPGCGIWAKWRRTGKSGGMRTLISLDDGATWTDRGCATVKLPRCGIVRSSFTSEVTAELSRMADRLTVTAQGVSKTFLVPPEVRYVRPWYDGGGRPIALTPEGERRRLPEVAP